MKNPYPTANILIVDDQAPNVLLLTRLLEQRGYENLTARAPY